jgi:hypothetical protein
VEPVLEGSEIPLAGGNYAVMSFLSLVDDFDGKISGPDLIKKWMSEPNRRPVILGPGKLGYVAFAGDPLKVIVMVASLFH